MKKKAKKKKQPRSWFRRLIRRAVLYAMGILVASLALYALVLSARIDERFAGRLWNLPSHVYSDATLLYTGQPINHALFVEKLKRLGYRETRSAPLLPGQMQSGQETISIYRNSFKASPYDQESMPVTIRISDGHIAAITRRDTGATLGLLTIEPEELALYFGPNRESRRLVSLNDLPPYVVHAVLSAEDHRFYEHRGVVVTGILRALWTNLREGGIRQGGSTITQQLAKNYFLTPERTLRRKVAELFIALLLEYKFQKNDILEIYLNEIYFGQKGSVSVNGLGEAARFYFNKEAKTLSISEAAALAGLIKAPNRFSPYANPALCRERRNTVLTAMHRQKWLTDQQLNAAAAAALTPAGYRAYRRQAPYFMDYVTDQLTRLYPREALNSQGLSIFTTIDTQVQAAAEDAVAKGLGRLETIYPELKRTASDERLQAALIVMQPKTGYILAMVGGRDYARTQLNRAIQARRQPGSAFKPFVYLSALDTHPLTTVLDNTPRTYTGEGTPWTPKNFDDNAPAEVTMRQALAQSQNIATINLALAVGMDRVARTARTFGLSVKPYPAAALGAFEVTPLDLARAYCAFPAEGMRPQALSVKEVVNDMGRVLESRHAEISALISPAEAYLMNDLLRTVVTSGTAQSLARWGVTWPTAGKTGTSNDARDTWFVGYTPDVLALVWVGFDDNAPTPLTGAKAALPIWAALMNSLPQYVSGNWFSMPPGVSRLTVCAESKDLARTGCCPRTTDEIFLDARAPQTPCRRHTCTPSALKQFLEGVKNIVPGF